MSAAKSKPSTSAATPKATIQVPCHRLSMSMPSVVTGSGKPIRNVASWEALEQAETRKRELRISPARKLRTKPFSMRKIALYICNVSALEAS